MIAYDVVVAGAGPGGGVAARELARAGVSVLLVERERFPRWKVCGGCLGPAARSRLRASGLADAVDARGVELSRLTLLAGRRRAAVALRDNLALSRAALDETLAREAESEGATLLMGMRARIADVADDGVVVELRSAGESRRVTARVVVDATGLVGGLGASDLVGDLRGVGARPRAIVAPDARIGLGAIFDDPRYDLRPGELRMVVAASGYVGLVRVEDGSINVGAAVAPAVVAESGAEAVVRSILASSRLSIPEGRREGWRGTPPLTRSPGVIAGNRFFRVGDAAGYVEPFTGEGIGWAMAAGQAVVPLVRRAVRSWQPDLAAEWAREQATRGARAQRTCRWLSKALRRPRLVRTTVGVLGPFPFLARPVVGAAGHT